MSQYYIISRQTPNGWSPARINVKPEDYKTVFEEISSQEPKPKLKVVLVTEEVILEDK